MRPPNAQVTLLATIAFAALVLGTGFAQSEAPPTTAPSTVAERATREPDALDRYASPREQGLMGWKRLSPDERAATAAFLDSISKSHHKPRTERLPPDLADKLDAMGIGWDPLSATAYLEREGWVRRKCEIVNIQGIRTFVVSAEYRRYATTSIPALLNADRMESARPNGEFWVRERSMGGIDRLLLNGAEYSFNFAQWQRAN